LAGFVQDLDLDTINVDYDALFGNFEAADCSAGPLLNLLVLLCASDNFKGRLLAELDKKLQLWNPYHLIETVLVGRTRHHQGSNRNLVGSSQKKFPQKKSPNPTIKIGLLLNFL
jgi:hypothetical protein